MTVMSLSGLKNDASRARLSQSRLSSHHGTPPFQDYETPLGQCADDRRRSKGCARPIFRGLFVRGRPACQDLGSRCGETRGDTIELAYPFSTSSTPFVVRRRDGRERFTCCAIDALGIAPMLDEDVQVISICHHCSSPLRFDVTPEGPSLGADVGRTPEGMVARQPARAWSGHEAPGGLQARPASVWRPTERQ